ncbi:hypothetical protein FC15_GL001266 [Lapidilactobacillus concavus DSM 17758]|uniref:Pore-forming protein n=1 Tax=Lapidilactobacillus concavus DSM 17758 TaxID=1423735 RepID=A0A0R1W5N9_9LACO|nr:EbsA family protein [Lapidilactobacillus concavus]KRM10662.1 hypothetical protein FC15_GL001266 [Lapidilactobacillus concavus DSM 17758]GEL12518.1 hypothetical protein LCO01nite_00670 [Lapidilactobacillus concavus]
MSKKNKIYCQPLTLNRLNLWLWVTCLLFLAIILQLEKTDSVSWIGVGLAVLFVVLTGYLFLSSFIRIDPRTKIIDAHYPFSRQPLVLMPAQIVSIKQSPHSLQIELQHQISYRFWMTHKKRQQLIDIWEGQ